MKCWSKATDDINRWIASCPSATLNTQSFNCSKLKQTVPLIPGILVIYTDNSIDLVDLQWWEHSLCDELKWNLSVVTPNDFLEQFVTRLPLTIDTKKTVCRLAQTFIHPCYVHFRFSYTPPSMIAAASVSSAARRILGSKWCHNNHINQALQQISNIELDCLLLVHKEIEKLLSDRDSTQMDSYQAKYYEMLVLSH